MAGSSNIWFHLPDCDSLPPSPPLCPSSIEDNITSLEEVTPSVEPLPSSEDSATVKTLECTQGFYQENGSSVCVPSCHAWTEHEGTTISAAIDITVFVTALIDFFAAIAVIVISIIRHKRMLVFPAVLVIYMVLDSFVIAIFLLVNYMDRPGLFCSYESLIKSLQKVTPFCVISGMLFSYTLLQMGFWWLLHIALLFWTVFFPFHFRSYERSGRMKHIHIASVIAGLMLPLSTIVTSMAKFAATVQKSSSNVTSSTELFLSGGLGYSNTKFPAILCASSDKDAVFYSTVLPLDLALAIGCTMLLTIFFHVHKQHSNLKVQEKHIFKFGTAEKKLLIVFSYYIVLSSIALTTFTISIRNIDSFIKGVQIYFFCEQGGFDPEHLCTRDYPKDDPFLTATSYALLGLFPVVNLIYAIDLKELKAALHTWLPKLKKKPSHNSKTPNTGSTAVTMSTFKRKASNI